MIIQDGKKNEASMEGLSQSQLESILGQQGQMFLEALSKKLKEMPQQTIIYGGQTLENQEEKEIKENSLDKIADIMSTVSKGNESNFNNRIGRIKKTKRDVSKEIDMLKDLE